MNVHRKSFVEEIRSLSEPMKRRIMFGAVAVCMVVVVYLWLAYFNTIIQNAVPTTAVQAPMAVSVPAAGRQGFPGLFADAASSFWQTVFNGAQKIAGALKNSKQYNINPK